MPSDSNLGTRIHSANDGTDGHVRIKIVGDPTGAGTTAAHHVAVDADKNAHIEVHGNDPAGTDRILRLSEQGSTVVDGVYHAANNSDPAQIGLVGMVRDVAPSDTQQTSRITSIANSTGSVRSLDVSMHDEDGEPYTATNPFPVTVSPTEGGVPVFAQNTKDDLVSAGTDNHDHVIAATKTFRLDQIVADASGDARYDLLIGDGATPTEAFTRETMTYSSNSKRGDVTYPKGHPITAGANPRTVRIIRKNLDNKQQDVHTTIIGVTF